MRDSVRVLPPDTLHMPGAMKVLLPGGSDWDDGYVYVPGTFIAAYHSDTRDTVSLDSVPAEILPVLYYTQSMSTGQKAIGYC